MKKIVSETLEMIQNMENSLKKNNINQFLPDDPIEKSKKPVYQQIILHVVDILHCSACGNDHYQLNVKKLSAPIEWYNHFVTCSTTNNPIYIKFTYEP